MAPQAEIDEEQLVSQALHDPGAFAALYNLYFSRVYNYIRCRVRQAGVTDDLTSAVFELVLAGLSTYRPERGRFAGWLWTIVRNVVADFFRRQKRHPVVSLEAVHGQGDPAPDPADIAIERETRAELLAAVQSLPEREQDVLGLKYWAGLSNRQIAGVTGLSAANVAVIVYRATRSLADRLAQGRENHG